MNAPMAEYSAPDGASMIKPKGMGLSEAFSESIAPPSQSLGEAFGEPIMPQESEVPVDSGLGEAYGNLEEPPSTMGLAEAFAEEKQEPVSVAPEEFREDLSSYTTSELGEMYEMFAELASDKDESRPLVDQDSVIGDIVEQGRVENDRATRRTAADIIGGGLGGFLGGAAFGLPGALIGGAAGAMGADEIFDQTNPDVSANLEARRVAPGKITEIKPMKPRSIGVETKDLLQAGIY